MEIVVKQGPGTCGKHNPVANQRNQQTATHDKNQTGVPGSSHIKEVQNLGGIDHARQGNAGAEQQSRDKSCEQAHRPKPLPHGEQHKP